MEQCRLDLIVIADGHTATEDDDVLSLDEIVKQRHRGLQVITTMHGLSFMNTELRKQALEHDAIAVVDLAGLQRAVAGRHEFISRAQHRRSGCGVDIRRRAPLRG